MLNRHIGIGIMIGMLLLTQGCGGGGGGSTSYSNNGVSQNGQQSTNPAGISNDATYGLRGEILSDSGGARVTERAAGDLVSRHVANPAPVAGATVTLTPVSGDAITAKTDSKGVFEIDKSKMTAGIYHVDIRGNDDTADFYISLDGARSMRTEFDASGNAYTSIVKPNDTSGWRREIEPDGSYTTFSGDSIIEKHTPDGLTVSYKLDGAESWTLDENGNFTDDRNDPNAPPLTTDNDSDSDGCHNMLDFDDDDNDNDGNSNFDDNDFNTNMLARHSREVASVPCMTTNFFSMELEATPNRGNAPLTVHATAKIKGIADAVDKYIWITGKPGEQPLETNENNIDIPYDKYGSFLLIVIVQLKNGAQALDTSSIVIVDDARLEPLVPFKTFDAVCTQPERNCYTMDVDIDQYGNIFVLAENWSAEYFNQISVHNPQHEWIDTLELDTEQKTAQNGTELLNLTLDKNGFIYVLDTYDPARVVIFNSLGERVSEVSLEEFQEDAIGGWEFKGLVVSNEGDIIVGHAYFDAFKWDIIRCSKKTGYQCKVVDTIAVQTDYMFGAIFDVDLDVSPQGEIVALSYGDLFFYNTDDDLLKTYPLFDSLPVNYQNLNSGTFQLSHLAIGPGGEIYTTQYYEHTYDPETREYYNEAFLHVFNSAGVYQYSLSIPHFNWDIFVDNLGILYITTYNEGIISLYAPEYIAGQALGRMALRSENISGFNVRRVKIVPLDI